MLDQKPVTIGKTDFIIEQLPTSKGLEVTIAIAQILKGVAEGVTDEFVLNFDQTKINVGKSIAGLVTCSSVKETPEFIKQLVIMSVKQPEMTGEDQLFEQHFAGNYAELSELLTEIIVFNKFHDLVKKNLFQFIAVIQEQ